MPDFDEKLHVGVTEIRCNRAHNALLGTVSADGQSLRIADTLFWRKTYMHCTCGRYRFRWIPSRLDDDTPDELEKEFN